MEQKLRIELGRTWLAPEEVASLGPGSAVELDSLTDEPVEIWVEGRLIARGEPAVLDGRFCVRVGTPADVA